jgi:hypothetical protein
MALRTLPLLPFDTDPSQGRPALLVRAAWRGSGSAGSQAGT